MPNMNLADEDLAPCVACDGGSNNGSAIDGTCHEVAGVFAKSRMRLGYHAIATIPAGACDIVIEAQDDRNFLALGWTSHKNYFLNGNWVIQQRLDFKQKGGGEANRSREPRCFIGIFF